MDIGTVEILLATYNGAAFLAQQLDSILAQTHTAWHLTISDDGSQDATGDIIDAYVARDPQRISRIRSGKHFGDAKQHFFFLMAQCRADYVFFCDQDDTWLPNRLERMLEVVHTAEDAAGKGIPLLVFCDQVPTDAQLRPLAPSLLRYQKLDREAFDYRSLLMRNSVTGGAMVCNRSLIARALACTQAERVIMHDGWLAVVAARFGRIICIDEPLGTYRQHDANSVGAKRVDTLAYLLKKLSAPVQLRARIIQKKQQAEVFMQTYAEWFNEADYAFLKPFCRKHSSPAFFWHYRSLIHDSVRFWGWILMG